MSRGWRHFEVPARKADITAKPLLKEILVRVQKGKRTVEKPLSSFLGNTLVGMHRMLVKNMLRAILMRSKMKMRNMPLDHGKAIIVIKWQRTWLNCVYVLVFCER